MSLAETNKCCYYEQISHLHILLNGGNIVRDRRLSLIQIRDIYERNHVSIISHTNKKSYNMCKQERRETKSLLNAKTRWQQHALCNGMLQRSLNFTNLSFQHNSWRDLRLINKWFSKKLYTLDFAVNIVVSFSAAAQLWLHVLYRFCCCLRNTGLARLAPC